MMEPYEQSADLIATQATQVRSAILAFQVNDQESYDKAGRILCELDTVAKRAEAERKDFKAPALQLCRKIDAKYKPGIKDLQDLITHLRVQMENHRARVQEANRAAVASIAQGYDPIQAVASMAHVPETAGTTVRREWTFDVVNPNMVPPEFLIVDEGALRDHMRAAVKEGRTPVVPGVRFYQQERIVRR